MFGFILINGEDLMLRGLPKKMKIARNMVLKTNEEIIKLLDEEPYHLSIEWLFKLVVQEINDQQHRAKNSVYLVDLMPNLKFMLRNEYLVKKDCTNAVQEFENQFPGTVSIDLCLPLDCLATIKSYVCPTTSEGQSDEMDVSRTSRRHALHENASRPFVKFFSQAQRLITVDASSGDKEAIWEAVRKLTADLQFPVKKHDDPVILFNFENLKMDWKGLNMHVIPLLKIAPNTDNETVLSSLEKLAQYVESTSSECSKFVVQVEGTHLATAKTEQLKRAIMFAAPAPGRADQAIQELNNVLKEPGHFKALCSTEDEMLVFPSSTDDEFCRRITVMFSDSHRAC
jgi:hypothetical protein